MLDTSNSSSNNIAIIAGASTAAVVVVLVIVGALIIVNVRKARGKEYALTEVELKKVDERITGVALGM